MKESTKNNFILPLFVVFIGVFILTPIANAFYDPNRKDIPFITPVLKFLSFLWNDIFNYKISIWIASMLLIIILIAINSYRRYKENQADVYDLEPAISIPDYSKYTQGILKVWKWKWNYRFDDNRKKYYIIDLTPVCDKCDIGMLALGYGTGYKCPKCNQIYPTGRERMENAIDIEAIIIHNAEKGNYPR